MHSVLTPSALRNLMDQLLLGDSELEAFILDHFPKIKRLYGGGMDRIAKVNLLFERVSCEEIYSKISQCYPQALSRTAKMNQSNNNRLNEKLDDDTNPIEIMNKSQVRYFLVLTGTIEEIDEPKLRALVSHIRRISGDAELTLEAIKAGSIVLCLKGSPDGLARLEQFFLCGQLTEILGYKLEAINKEHGEFESGNLFEHEISISNANTPYSTERNSLNSHRDTSVHSSADIKDLNNTVRIEQWLSISQENRKLSRRQVLILAFILAILTVLLTSLFRS